MPHPDIWAGRRHVGLCLDFVHSTLGKASESLTETHRNHCSWTCLRLLYLKPQNFMSVWKDFRQTMRKETVESRWVLWALRGLFSLECRAWDLTLARREEQVRFILLLYFLPSWAGI